MFYDISTCGAEGIYFSFWIAGKCSTSSPGNKFQNFGYSKIDRRGQTIFKIMLFVLTERVISRLCGQKTFSPIQIEGLPFVCSGVSQAK